MKSILCALDFSEASLDVMKKAFELASQTGNMLVFLFSFRLVQPHNSVVAEYRKNMEVRAKQDFDELVKRLKIKSSIPYEFRLEIGFISDRIEAFVKKNDVEQIVLSHALAQSIIDHTGLSLENRIKLNNTQFLVVVSSEKNES